MKEQSRHLLLGRWLHSHEEDTATESVYRPGSFPFGPSRGRRGFEFRPDGSCTSIGIAAQDGPAEEHCKWEVKNGKDLRAILHFDSGKDRIFRIASVDSDKLVVRKEQT
jgi:hypothetical protein